MTGTRRSRTNRQAAIGEAVVAGITAVSAVAFGVTGHAGTAIVLGCITLAPLALAALFFGLARR
jgi:hypothetical protein